mgnify:CR=1 FL=1
MNEEIDYESLFLRFKDFTKKAFPEANADSYLTKIKEELSELEKDQNIDELADCILVLIGLSRFIRGDLKAAIANKIEINENRKWEKKEDGTYHHC